MTNPGDIVRIRSRNGGRGSVYEANMWAQAYTQGVLSGAGVVENTSPDMTVLVGGTPSSPDVVIATNPSGYRIALDIVGQQPVTITAPASNSRVTSIVAYTDDLSVVSTQNTITGTPNSCGLIVVNGSSGVNPNPPSDATIRSAITTDGATGSQAAYVVLASLTIAAAQTTITNTDITKGLQLAQVTTAKIADEAITPAKLGDTGWKSLNYASAYNSNSSGEYRKIGNVVYLRGLIVRNSGNMSNGQTMGSVPTEARPAVNLPLLCVGTGNTTTKLGWASSGVISVSTAGGGNHVSLAGISYVVD